MLNKGDLREAVVRFGVRLMRIVILGWGSLLWDIRQDFDGWHEEWQPDGPNLKIEFSRVSKTRNGALTLVLDKIYGRECQVAYTLSRRRSPDDAICDLRCREGTTRRNIGFYFANGFREQARDPEVLRSVGEWSSRKNIDVAIWTDLQSNFEKQSICREPFSLQNALSHIQSLDPDGKAAAAEYVWRAPSFVHTPLREALESYPWFPAVE